MIKIDELSWPLIKSTETHLLDPDEWSNADMRAWLTSDYWSYNERRLDHFPRYAEEMPTEESYAFYSRFIIAANDRGILEPDGSVVPEPVE